MQLSIVNRSKLNPELRLDAEYYRPLALATETRILSRPHWLSGRLFDVYSGPFGSTVTTDRYDQASNLRYIRGKDVYDFFIDESDPVNIQKSLFDELSQYHLKPLDILVTVVGMNFGKSALVFFDDCPSIFSCKSSLIRNVKVNPFYLTAYFSCKYGYALIRRGQRGAAQPGINLFDLKNIPVPIVSGDFQDAIKKLVLQSRETKKDSSKQYTQAEQLLLSELDLQNWKPFPTFAYTRNYSQAARTRRLDAEYFQPKYDEGLSHIVRFAPKRLSTFGTQVTETVIFDESKKYRYVEIGDVNTATGEVGFTERQAKELPPNAKIRVVGGELIISKVRPTRGAIGLIPNECNDNGVCSSAFTVLKVPPPSREFLQVYLRSIIGKTILEKPCRGTSYPTIDDIDIKMLPIPTISQTTIEQISHLVRQSREAQQNAKILLDRAKRAVEIAIEENEDKALEVLKKG
jgi:restriction endonuclease S subunit